MIISARNMTGSFEVYDNLAKLKDASSRVRETAYLRLKQLESMDIIDFETLVAIKNETKELHVLNYVIEALGMRKEERCYQILYKMFQNQQNILILQTLLYAFINSKSDYFVPVVLDKLQFKSGLLRKKHRTEFLKVYNNIIHLAIKYFQTAANEKTVAFLLPLLKSKNATIRMNVLLTFDMRSLTLSESILSELTQDESKNVSAKAKYMLKKRQQAMMLS